MANVKGQSFEAFMKRFSGQQASHMWLPAQQPPAQRTVPVRPVQSPDFGDSRGGVPSESCVTDHLVLSVLSGLLGRVHINVSATKAK